MKRRFYALMLVVAMLAMTLVACGSDTNDTTNTTNDVTVNTEVEESGDDVVVEPTEEPTTTPEVEEPVVEPTEEPEVVEPETPEFAYAFTWAFPDGMDGFTQKFLNEDYPEWSVNKTHYVAANGNEMNFTWEGPASLGETAWSGEKTLFLTDARYDYELRAWCFPIATQEDALRNFDKDTIVNWDANATIYTENDYYDFTDGEEVARVIFKITRNIDGVEYIGYACYFDNYETNVCYQITYLEKAEVFDDTHALNLVNSLDFWNYVPEETTIE